ncbi:MAG: alpha-1,2-fucosyltransferase [bacterium]
MIIIEIYGGLGNQFFQYSFAKNFAIKNNLELKIDCLTNYNNETSILEFGLKYFNIDDKLATIDDIRKVKYNNPNIFNKIKYKLRNKELPGKAYKISPHCFHEDPDNNNLIEYFDNLKIKKQAYISGFFQSQKYFIEIADIIKQNLILKDSAAGANLEMLNRIKSSNSISLHIRRTDYLNKETLYLWGNICTDEYYKNAIKYISQKVDNPTFFVFSDDIEYCKNNINPGFETVFVDINNDITAHEDMRLMSNCKHNIIANSTFSWWGTWLNSNPNKIVVSPPIWFNDGQEYHKKIGILCDDWIKISK